MNPATPTTAPAPATATPAGFDRAKLETSWKGYQSHLDKIAALKKQHDTATAAANKVAADLAQANADSVNDLKTVLITLGYDPTHALALLTPTPA